MKKLLLCFCLIGFTSCAHYGKAKSCSAKKASCAEKCAAKKEKCTESCKAKKEVCAKESCKAKNASECTKCS